MKYTTLADLAEAYKSGELSEDEPLWLDSDRTTAYADPGLPDVEPERVFLMHPDKLLYEALELLGIPTDHN